MPITNNTFNFKRWDGCIFEITYSDDATDTKQLSKKIENVTRIRNEVDDYTNCDNVSFLIKESDGYNNSCDFVRLTTKDGICLFKRDDFIKKVELKNSKSIKIGSIADYLKLLQKIRFVALIVRLKALLCQSSPKTQKNSKELRTKFETFLRMLQKEECSGITEKEEKQIMAGINEMKTNDAKDLNVKESMKKTIERFQKGENFMYYRGVGHIVYPEIPNALRGANQSSESEYYRQGKIGYPNELSDLSYLDRIAKLQHFGWPTRLLDVTANPLIALYMACNTIYNTDDLPQKDYGEIIVYFRTELNEKSYDSKAVLIAAALVKLTSIERNLMYEFIRMHQRTGKSSAILNLCIQIAAERTADTVLNETERTNCRKLLFDLTKNEIGKTETPLSIAMDYYFEGIKNPEKSIYTQQFKDFIEAYRRLLVTIRREVPSFQNKIDVFSMMKSYHFKIGMTNERIQAQAGSFIIAGLDDRYINDSEEFVTTRKKGFKRIIVENKKEMMEQLKLLNINDSTVIPDIQHGGEFERKMLGH